MVEAQKKDKEILLNFSKDESNAIGLDPTKEYSLAKASNGIWVMVEGKDKKISEDLEAKIIGMINTASLSDRVEGAFEKKLDATQLAKFNEMITQKKIEKFKLNESYKKAVYQAPGRVGNFENTEKPFQEFTIENDGFVVVKNEARAKQLSNELRTQIKGGEIKGTRSFSGEFFIINTQLLQNSENKILKELKEFKNIDLDNLSSKTGLTKTLSKIAVEFLKEDGQLLEKTAGNYQYIE